jgi:hypothetical protein
MKNYSTERMAPQACGNFMLAFRHAGGTIRRGERSRKIEVKTSVDSRAIAAARSESSMKTMALTEDTVL